MVLRDRHGRESIRQMRFKVLEVPGDGDKSLFVFDQPRDVRGTALLTTPTSTFRTTSGCICRH